MEVYVYGGGRLVALVPLPDGLDDPRHSERNIAEAVQDPIADRVLCSFPQLLLQPLIDDGAVGQRPFGS